MNPKLVCLMKIFYESYQTEVILKVFNISMTFKTKLSPLLYWWRGHSCLSVLDNLLINYYQVMILQVV